MTGPPDLYHWTCSHRVHSIAKSRTVETFMGLSWWTDIDTRTRRHRAALGLTSNLLGCDRMEYRCRADGELLGVGLIPWQQYVADHGIGAAEWVTDLARAPGADPARWWVAEEPVPVRSVRRWQPPARGSRR